MSYPSVAERRAALETLRAICLALPETSERLSHGSPTFFVREKKSFLTLVDDHHGDGRFAIGRAAPPGDQQLLVEADPERFVVPPYVGHRGWLGVRLDRGVDRDELRRDRRGCLLHGCAASRARGGRARRRRPLLTTR